VTNTTPEPAPVQFTGLLDTTAEPIALKRRTRTLIYIVAAPVAAGAAVLAAEQSIDPHTLIVAGSAALTTLVATVAGAHISGS
jgi:hypothetical protein